MNYKNISTYGKATKYRVEKRVLKAVFVALMVVIPLVTPLSVFAGKIFKKDLFYIRRYEV